MSPTDAHHFGVRNGQRVRVAVDSDGRDLVFGDVVVRVSPEYRLELHLDTDEGNAAGVGQDATAKLLVSET
jgi:propanediol utilization protein